MDDDSSAPLRPSQAPESMDAMGSVRDTIRGATRAEVYDQLMREKRRINGSGLELISPSGTKADVYAEMTQDSSTGEWLLPIHFSS